MADGIDIVVNGPTDPTPGPVSPSTGISPEQIQQDIATLDTLLKRFDRFIPGQAGSAVKVFEVVLEYLESKVWAAELFADVVNAIQTKQPPTKEELLKLLQDFLANP